MCLNLAKGEEDHRCNWPFKEKVKVCLVLKTGALSTDLSIEPERDESWRNKSTSCHGFGAKNEKWGKFEPPISYTLFQSCIIQDNQFYVYFEIIDK